MHAYLIVNSSVEERLRIAEATADKKGISNNPSYRHIQNPEGGSDKLISIDDVRELRRFVAHTSRKPRAVLIIEAQRMTIPAQHALLKTVEDPGDNILVILTADSEQALLPTILSRCRIIRLGSSSVADSEMLPDIKKERGRLLKLKSLKPGERLLVLYRLISGFSGRTISQHQGAIQRSEAIKFTEWMVKNLRCIPQKDATTAQIIRLAAQAHNRLKQNLNPNLTLQQFVLDIPRES